jgi:hypothetical protein
MSYDGGGAASQGPTNSIQLSNGSGGFAGSTGFYYNTANNYLYGGANGNYIRFEDGASNMEISPELSTGNLYLYGGASGLLNLQAGSLGVVIGGAAGSAGQYLGSNGAGGVTWSTPTGGPLYQATYYKSAVQNLTSGATDITFDEEGSWNNANGYITHTGGTADFTVVEAGLYQLEWNTTISANGATWTTTTNKFISIDVTRSPTAEQAIIGQSAFMASGTNYAQSVCSTFNLEAGDVINCRVVNTFTGGPPQALGVQNTIDLNTWFSWRYVSSGSGGGGGDASAWSTFPATQAVDFGTNNIYNATAIEGLGGEQCQLTVEVIDGTQYLTLNQNIVGPSVVASGTIDQTGFAGPTGASSLWYKDVNVSGMYPNGLVLATANGTPEISYSAWIVTVKPDTDKITIWTAADPVSAGQTWEAHYVVTNFGTFAPPPDLNFNSTDDSLIDYAIPAGYNTLTYKLVGGGGGGGVATTLQSGAGGGGGGQYLTDTIAVAGATDTITLVKGIGGDGDDGVASTFTLNSNPSIEALGGLVGVNGAVGTGGNGGDGGAGAAGGAEDNPGLDNLYGGGGGGGGNSVVTAGGGWGGDGGGEGIDGYGDGNGGAAGIITPGTVGTQGSGYGAGGGGGSNNLPPTSGSDGFWEVTISYVAPS